MSTLCLHAAQDPSRPAAWDPKFQLQLPLMPCVHFFLRFHLHSIKLKINFFTLCLAVSSASCKLTQFKAQRKIKAKVRRREVWWSYVTIRSDTVGRLEAYRELAHHWQANRVPICVVTLIGLFIRPAKLEFSCCTEINSLYRLQLLRN